jgi:hypothetical protein
VDCLEVDPPVPRSGVAIQFRSIVVAKRLKMSKQGKTSDRPPTAMELRLDCFVGYRLLAMTILFSSYFVSRAAQRRGDPVQGSLDCVVGSRLFATTTGFLIRLDRNLL